MVQLCRFHHRQVHEGNVLIQTLDDGALRFVRPDRLSFDSVAPGSTRPPYDWRALLGVHEQLGIPVDRDTATSRWRGEDMDYGLAVEVLFQQARRGSDVSAGTLPVG
jgi:hypothetical protein